MITLISACILTGCTTSIPVIVSNQPVRAYLRQRPAKVDRSEFSCYVNGEFFESCPQ